MRGLHRQSGEGPSDRYAYRAESSRAAKLRAEQAAAPSSPQLARAARQAVEGRADTMVAEAACELVGRAAERGEVRRLERLLGSGLSPNAWGAQDSPLRRAIRYDRAPAVALLLQYGARFGRRRDERLGMLGWAVRHRAEATLPLLVEHACARGQGAAAAVLATAHNPVFMNILATGSGCLPETAGRMLWDAARVGDASAVDMFLGAGVTAGTRYRLRWPGAPLPGTSGAARIEAGALQVAALAGHTCVITMLVAHQAHRPLDAAAFYTTGAGQSPEQLSALGLAITQGHGRAMWALVEQGAAWARARLTQGAWQGAADLALACGQDHLRPLLSQFERLERAGTSPPRQRTRWCGLVHTGPAPSRQMALMRREVEVLSRPFRAPQDASARAGAPKA